MKKITKHDVLRVISFFLVILLITFAVCWFVNRQGFRDSRISSSFSDGVYQKRLPFSGGHVFEKMTIPYLRNRDYDGEILETILVSEKELFSSYLVKYSSDNLKINGYLTKPNGEMPIGGWPAIVFVHGYIPPSNYLTTVNYVSYVTPFAESGFIVLKIDLRGHGESEGDASGAYFSGDYVVDTLNAYSALGKLDYVNDEMIGLWGHSMGGNIVARSVAVNTNIPAAVIWAGAVYTYEDFGNYSITDSSYQPPVRDSNKRREIEKLFEVHGEFSLDSDFWKQVPATNYLDDVSTSFQVHHATDDPVVDIEYSRGLIKLLQKNEIENEIFEYSSGGHNLKGVVFARAMDRSIEFYKQTFAR